MKIWDKRVIQVIIHPIHAGRVGNEKTKGLEKAMRSKSRNYASEGKKGVWRI